MDFNSSTTMSKPKAAILTFSRTGSSTLTKVIRKAGIKAISEAFSLSQNNNNVRIVEHLYNIKSMRKSLDLLYSKYNVLQHKFRNVRMSWNLELIEYLKENNIPVLLYYRKDYTNRIKSKIISNQTKQWLAFSKPLDYYKVDNILNSAFVRMIEDYLIELNFYEHKMKETGLEYKTLFFEQLFGKQVTFEDQLEIIYDLLDYFCMQVGNKENFKEKAKPLLHPSRKMNTKKTYQIIPNINELEAYINNFDFETHLSLQKD
jgi:hypothetical protein